VVGAPFVIGIEERNETNIVAQFDDSAVARGSRSGVALVNDLQVEGKIAAQIRDLAFGRHRGFIVDDDHSNSADAPLGSNGAQSTRKDTAIALIIRYDDAYDAPFRVHRLA
jgi:hypothetical protein